MSRVSPKPMTAPCASRRRPLGPRLVQRRPAPPPRHHHREAAAICFSVDSVVIFFLGAGGGGGGGASDSREERVHLLHARAPPMAARASLVGWPRPHGWLTEQHRDGALQRRQRRGQRLPCRRRRAVWDRGRWRLKVTLQAGPTCNGEGEGTGAPESFDTPLSLISLSDPHWTDNVACHISNVVNVYVIGTVAW
jgi:hypothetical protein